MGWGSASAGAICNIGWAAKASSADFKATSVDGEFDFEGDGEAEVVMLGLTAARLSGPVPASTDQTKMTNPHRIATPRMSSPASTTQPLTLTDLISVLVMAHTAPKPLRNAYRPT